MLDLHHRRSLDGEPLGQRDFVIRADEKTSIQARVRKHATAPPTRGEAMRVEHESTNAAGRWPTFGRSGCPPRQALRSFSRALHRDRAVRAPGRAGHGRGALRLRRAGVLDLVDNGGSHRGRASIDRLRGAWSNLVLVHLPVDASWLNQIEIYFCIVRRKVLTPNDFTDLGEVEARLLGFQDHYEKVAQPFEWKSTRADLDAVLAKIQGQHPSTAEAA